MRYYFWKPPTPHSLFLPFYTLKTENRVLRRIFEPKRDEVTGE